ncbi:DUF1697 domain-containing protein [Serinibacter arcticus]|uniref:DUF1697 domain-containing protein n=1 Tax=Serinibacter arcticus TaxID=1655435 RepID=A0A4Z1E006_9MICO|nr:DUF1697 domain-containing protein [Serinibacter arcticus]TGO04660.1 hypothetical protein SERN_2253 [Serinibacter arcticus]
MSSRWAVLLRGVNVGGVTVRSADLRSALAEAGFIDVRTVLASGNALVTVGGDGDGTGADAPPADELDGADVRARVEAALLVRFGREVRVVVLSQVALTAVVDACPYAADSETHHAYVVLLGDPDAAGTAFETVAAVVPTPGASAAGEVDEAVAAGVGVLYWWCPRGSSLSTPVSKAVERLSRTSLTTTRNLRTLARLTHG